MKTLKDICQEYGITQTELSRRFDIPLRTVQNWHGGQRTPPPYVLKLLEALLKGERKDIYVIYTDSQDDAATILGYVGTVEEADAYCEDYNNKRISRWWPEASWELLEELTEGKERTT